MLASKVAMGQRLFLINPASHDEREVKFPSSVATTPACRKWALNSCVLLPSSGQSLPRRRIGRPRTIKVVYYSLTNALVAGIENTTSFANGPRGKNFSDYEPTPGTSACALLLIHE